MKKIILIQHHLGATEIWKTNRRGLHLRRIFSSFDQIWATDFLSTLLNLDHPMATELISAAQVGSIEVKMLTANPMTSN